MYNNKILSIVGIIIVFSLIFTGCDSDPTNGNNPTNVTVKGTVTDNDEDPLDGVELVLEDENETLTDTTSSEGIYSFDAELIEDKSYKIIYEEQETRFSVTEGDTEISVDINLEDDPSVSVVENKEEFDTAILDEAVNSILLDDDLTLTGGWTRALNSDLTIDGRDEYKITGAGRLLLLPEDNNRDLTFKNITFEPPNNMSEWYEDYYILTDEYNNNIINITFDNINIDRTISDPENGSFYINLSDSDLKVMESSINIENVQAFDMNKGGTGVFKNNDFNASGAVLVVNNHYIADLTIENNDFSDVDAFGCLGFRTYHGEETITVNDDNVLKPVDGSTVTEEDYENAAFTLHQSIKEKNDVKTDYTTWYFDNEDMEGFIYIGDDDEPQYIEE